MQTKYQTSPIPSRSPSSLSNSLRGGSPLPVPVAYRFVIEECYTLINTAMQILDTNNSVNDVICYQNCRCIKFYNWRIGVNRMHLHLYTFVGNTEWIILKKCVTKNPQVLWIVLFCITCFMICKSDGDTFFPCNLLH